MFIVGQLGVGKLMFVNVVEFDLEFCIQELSDYLGKGQYIIIFVEMYVLCEGGVIIDILGIKLLFFIYLELMDVAYNFKEFFKYFEDCKFGGNCLYCFEFGCVVWDVVELEELSVFCYENYLIILEEVEDQNYWECYKGI